MAKPTIAVISEVRENNSLLNLMTAALGSTQGLLINKVLLLRMSHTNFVESKSKRVLNSMPEKLAAMVN